MNNIEIFNFEGQEIRIFVINGEIWAVAKDVALLLGYIDAPKAVAQHCKNPRSAKDFPRWVNHPP